jgi:hypothetical protein
LFCRRELHERCAAASGELGSAGMRWSAVNGSFGFLPSPHIQQAIALSLICLARSSIVAFVVEAFRFRVLPVPKGLAVGAACGVSCEVSTVQAGSCDCH